jgi:hypothetical protein
MPNRHNCDIEGSLRELRKCTLKSMPPSLRDSSESYPIPPASHLSERGQFASREHNYDPDHSHHLFRPGRTILNLRRGGMDSPVSYSDANSRLRINVSPSGCFHLLEIPNNTSASAAISFRVGNGRGRAGMRRLALFPSDKVCFASPVTRLA